jgi:hypothetical protein
VVSPQLRQLMADLEAAQLDLAEATVYAPSDGYVTNVALREGAVVASLPMSPAMTFVDTSEKALALFVKQTNLRHVQPGQEAEVILDMYPGQVFEARVVSVVEGTRQGQALIGGTLTAEGPQRHGPFAVRLELLQNLKDLHLPPGAGGSGAVFTGQGKPTYLIRRVMLRMVSLLNYVR